MKRLICLLLLLVLTIKIASSQFVNCYAPSNWTVSSTNTNGSVYTTSNYFDIIADTDQNGNGTAGLGCSPTANGNVKTCITVPSTGTIMFIWTWTGGNNATLLAEPFGYCLNNVATDLTLNTYYGGAATVNVVQGDNFCFTLSSQFANSHPTLFTHVNVSNFSAPSCTPSSVLNSNGSNSIQIISTANNILTVKGTAANKTIKLFNAIGKDVLAAKTTDLQTTLILANLPSGIYIVKYKEANFNYNKKIVKL